MDRVIVSNITMDRIGAPIFLRLGNRARPFKKDIEKPGIGAMRNITISNVEATGAGLTGCAIAGLPQAAIENVTLSNLRLSFEGGGAKADADRTVPEKPDSYPEYSMFGVLPTYGLYCRHVKGLKLLNVQLQLAKADQRRAVFFEDVEDAFVDSPDISPQMIRLVGVKDVHIRVKDSPK